MELELMKVKEEMKNAKLEHKNKALRAELAHQKLLNAHMTLQTKMEEYQNKQQQNFDDLTEKLKVCCINHLFVLKIINLNCFMDESLKSVQTMVDAELEAEKQSNANKFAEIEQKSGKLEKYQKEQLNIVRLQKTVATLKIGWGSVRAENPMAKTPYFEVTILEKKGAIFTCDQTNAVEQIQWTSCHRWKTFVWRRRRRRLWRQFGTRQIIYKKKNGERLGEKA
ncbi:hypothetical protein GPALN_003316 [Globodera pallida]|nr:hypothetical protein GPALN_003316 [Globodera pallida]